MPHRYTSADFNLTPLSDQRLGGRLTTSMLFILVPVFIATGEDAGLIVGGALFCLGWPAFILVWSDADAASPPGSQTSPTDEAPIRAFPLAIPCPRTFLRGMRRLIAPSHRPRLLPAS